MIKKLKIRFILVNMLILTFVLFATLSSIYIMMSNSEIKVSDEIMENIIENHQKASSKYERDLHSSGRKQIPHITDIPVSDGDTAGTVSRKSSENTEAAPEAELSGLIWRKSDETEIIKLSLLTAEADIISPEQNADQPVPYQYGTWGNPWSGNPWENPWWENPWGGSPDGGNYGQEHNNPENEVPKDEKPKEEPSQNSGSHQNEQQNGQQNPGGESSQNPWDFWWGQNQWPPPDPWNGQNPWLGQNPWAEQQQPWGDYNPWENPPWPGWPNWPPAEESASASPSEAPSAEATAPAADSRPSPVPEYIPTAKPDVQDTPESRETTGKVTEAESAAESSRTEPASKPSGKPDNNPPPEPKYDGNMARSHILADIDEKGNIAALWTQNFMRYADDSLENEEEFGLKVENTVKLLASENESEGTCTVDTVSFRYRISSPGPENKRTLVLLDRSIEVSTLHRLLITFIFIGCAGLVIVFFFSLFLASWAIKPIEVAWNRQKQFIADASHELKTPLTVISTNTDVVLSVPDDYIRNQERWLRYIKDETARMSKLVTELLYIAKSDSNEIKMDMHDFDISATVSGVCLNFEALAFEAEKELAADISPKIKYFGDEDRIKQLVTILIDNAIKYSIIGSQISVSLFRNNQNKVKICVSNKCENLTEENVSKLFDRFYRVDSSRNSGTGGNGLGLNIAQTIAEAHNGSVTVNYNHGIISFVVTL